MPEEKKNTLDSCSEVSYFQQSCGNVEYQFVSNSSLNQPHAPTTDSISSDHHTGYLISTFQLRLFPFNQIPQVQDNLMPFFFFFCSRSNRHLAMPIYRKRRNLLKKPELEVHWVWRIFGSRGSGCRDWGTEWGETSQGEVWGFWIFFPLKSRNTAAIL